MAELATAALEHDAGQFIKVLRHLPGVLKTIAGLAGPAPARAGGSAKAKLSFGPKTPLNVVTSTFSPSGVMATSR